jgi:hypothetical protein
MLVFSYGIELDALGDKDEAASAALAAEAARAYKARAACLRAAGESDKAKRDDERAELLVAKAKKGDKDKTAAADAPAKSGDVQVRNDWKVPVTVVIGGASYTLQIGEQKKIPAPAASFTYELQVGANRAAGTMEAGKTYRIAE